MDSYILGVVVGLGLVVLLALLIIVFTGKNSPMFDGFSESSYDERQQRARVKAFKAGFFTLLIYNAMYAATTALLSRPWCDVPTGCFLGICLSVSVFAVTCIMKDAYFTLKNNPRRIGALFAFITVLNGVPAVVNVVNTIRGEDGMITDGMLNFRCLNPVMVVMFLVIFAAMGVKRLMDKREAEE